MENEVENPSSHTLIVTGPERQRLYQRFATLFAGREGVQVVLDRRQVERRRDARAPQGGERRSGDRRRSRPDWVVPPN